MSLRRRFLNLVLEDVNSGIYSLSRIDLSRQGHGLFYPASASAAFDNSESKKKKNKKSKDLTVEEMETIRVPAPIVSFQPNPSADFPQYRWKVNCFGLSDTKVVCTDNSGNAFLYDTAARRIGTMPTLNQPKFHPISFPIPGAGADKNSIIYIMETIPKPKKGQFEAFIHTQSSLPVFNALQWQCNSLPLPPYVLDPAYEPAEIYSHAVLGGGSHLCISVEGFGTYVFDTAMQEWSHAGDWMLPFDGKAEYVPELDLWFGISDSGHHPSVSDLSTVVHGIKPRLCRTWREEDPPEWNYNGVTKVASLGSGRFCVVRFYKTTKKDCYCFGDPVTDKTFAVFTGVELVDGNGHGGASGKRNGRTNGCVKGGGNGNGSGSDNGHGNGTVGGKGNGNGCVKGGGNGNGSDSDNGHGNGTVGAKGNGNGFVGAKRNGNGNGKGTVSAKGNGNGSGSNGAKRNGNGNDNGTVGTKGKGNGTVDAKGDGNGNGTVSANGNGNGNGHGDVCIKGKGNGNGNGSNGNGKRDIRLINHMSKLHIQVRSAAIREVL